jgi:hypothetical protein
LVRKNSPLFFASSSNVKSFYHHLQENKLEGFSYLMSSLPNNPPLSTIHGEKRKSFVKVKGVVVMGYILC